MSLAIDVCMLTNSTLIGQYALTQQFGYAALVLECCLTFQASMYTVKVDVSVTWGDSVACAGKFVSSKAAARHNSLQ